MREIVRPYVAPGSLLLLLTMTLMRVTYIFTANDEPAIQAVADGNNPGTYTNTVALKINITGGNIIVSYDSDPDSAGNWDVIEVNSTSPTWTFKNPNSIPCNDDGGTGILFELEANCLAPTQKYQIWETLTISPYSCMQSIRYTKQSDNDYEWSSDGGVFTFTDTIQNRCPPIDQPCDTIDSKYWNVMDTFTGDTISAPSEDVEIDEAPPHLPDKILISDSQLSGSPFNSSSLEMMLISIVSRRPVSSGAYILNFRPRAGFFSTNDRIWLFLLMFFAGLARIASAADDAIQSKWDKELLSVQLGDVSIQAGSMDGAWEEIATKYLLRANLYMDVSATSVKNPFFLPQGKGNGNRSA